MNGHRTPEPARLPLILSALVAVLVVTGCGAVSDTTEAPLIDGVLDCGSGPMWAMAAEAAPGGVGAVDAQTALDEYFAPLGDRFDGKLVTTGEVGTYIVDGREVVQATAVEPGVVTGWMVVEASGCDGFQPDF